MIYHLQSQQRTPSLPARSIHKHSLPTETYELSHPRLGRHYWLNGWVKEFPTIAQLRSIRGTMINRSDDRNIRAISFWLLQPIRALSLWVTWFSCFQQLAYGKVAVSVWFSSLLEQKRYLPPQMRVETKVRHPLVDSWWGRQSWTFEPAPCLKPKRDSCWSWWKSQTHSNFKFDRSISINPGAYFYRQTQDCIALPMVSWCARESFFAKHAYAHAQKKFRVLVIAVCCKKMDYPTNRKFSVNVVSFCTNKQHPLKLQNLL